MCMQCKKYAVGMQLFMFYAMTGWIYEEILEVCIYRTGFTNRGFLFGPYLPVYGFGALLFLFLLYPIKQQRRFSYATPAVIFLGSMLIATLVELLTSYGLDYFHLQLWNYNHYAMNFQGRIALNPSIRFGIGGILFLYILQPIFERILAKQTDRMQYIISTAMVLIVVVDVITRMTLA